MYAPSYTYSYIHHIISLLHFSLCSIFFFSYGNAKTERDLVDCYIYVVLYVAVAVSVHVLKTISIEWESVGALNFPFGFQYQTKQNSKHIGKECKIIFILTLSRSAAKRTKTSLLQK